MAGFDLGSLLGGLLGNKQQSGDGSQPQQGGAAGGLGGLLNSDLLAKLTPLLGGLLAGGGLTKLMGQLKGAGLGDQAKSWVATDQANQPVTGDQLSQALGQDTISQFANTMGLTNEQAAQTMAQTLPQVVDAMTPEGRLPAGAAPSQVPDAPHPGSGPPAV